MKNKVDVVTDGINIYIDSFRVPTLKEKILISSFYIL